MLTFVIGLPGHFAEWCQAVALQCVERRAGGAAVAIADTPEQIARALLRAGAGGSVIAASRPGARIRAALAEANSPFVVALDDPRRVLADLVLDRQLEWTQALRQVASSCAPAISHAMVPCALAVRASDPPEQTAAAILRHLGGSADEISTTVLQSAAFPQRSMAQVEAWWSSLPPQDRAMAEGALDLYLTPPDALPPPLRWAPALFLNGTRSAALAGPVDITGRKRILFDGPDIAVADGAWRLTLTADFSRTAADYEYRLEVIAGTSLASLEFRPPGEGKHQGVLEFRVTDSVDHPVSIRLSLQRSAFDGTVTLKSAILEPVP